MSGGIEGRFVSIPRQRRGGIEQDQRVGHRTCRAVLAGFVEITDVGGGGRDGAPAAQPATMRFASIPRRAAFVRIQRTADLASFMQSTTLAAWREATR